MITTFTVLNGRKNYSIRCCDDFFIKWSRLQVDKDGLKERERERE